MATKRKEYRLRGGDIIDREEFPDIRHGSPGGKRLEKKNQRKRICRKSMQPIKNEKPDNAFWNILIRGCMGNMDIPGGRKTGKHGGSCR